MRRITALCGAVLFTAANCGARGAEPLHIIPFDFHDNRIYVDVSVEGAAPVPFLFDTGSWASSIDRDYAASLKLKWLTMLGPTPELPPGIRHLPMAYSVDVELQAGGWKETLPTVQVVPHAATFHAWSKPYFGVLGAVLLEKFVVVIDYVRGELRLHQPQSFTYTGRGVPVSLRLPESRRRNSPVDRIARPREPWVEARLGTSRNRSWAGSFRLNTSQSASVIIPDDTYLGRRLRERNGVVYCPSEAQWGEFPRWIVRLDHLRLGGIRLPNPLVTLSSFVPVFGPSELNGTIGNEFLRRFTVTFDYSRERLYLEANAALGESEDHDMSGIVLRQAQPGFRCCYVSNVTLRSPAAEAGIQAGDTLVQIDGRNASEMRMAEVAAMLKQAGATRTLTVMRKGQLRQASIVLRRLI